MSALELLQGDHRERAPERSSSAVIVVAGATLAVAAVTVGLMSLIAAPSGAHARLSTATAAVATMETAMAKAGGPSAYPADAVCPSKAEGVSLVQSRLQEAAAVAGIPLSDVTVAQGSGNEASGLTPISISFSAKAQYDVLLKFLGSLGESQPEVFVDAADITPDTSVATLQFSGRALCWTIARQ